jgi:hypothetical protein
MNARIAVFATAMAVGAVALPAFGQNAAGNNRGAAADNQAQRQMSDQERREMILSDLKERFPENAVEVGDRQPIELRMAINQLVRDSLSADRIDQAFSQLSRVNRNELGQVSQQQKQALRQEIQALQQALQQKYGRQVSFDNIELFDNAALVRLEVKDAQALGRLPLRPIAGGQRDVARAEGNADGRAQPAAAGQRDYGTTPSTYGIENGSKLAVMGLPPQAGVPRFLVTAVEESRPAAGEKAGEWRIILPMNLTGDTLAQNLTQHLRDLRQKQNQWPEEADQAIEAVGRRVLMAYYNIDPNTAAQHRAGANQQNQSRRQNQQNERHQRQQQDQADR